jgi:phosphoribosylformylglycinamidine synthase subunit PurS
MMQDRAADAPTVGGDPNGMNMDSDTRKIRIEPASQSDWVAEIRVLLKASVNDPQGISIRGALKSLGFGGVEDVRAGKFFQIRLSASDRHSAADAVERMCAQLLANPVIETFEFTLAEAPERVP